MLDKVGPFLIWALFLGAIWRWAQPVLAFVGGALIATLVIIGVVRKFEVQGDELAKSWKKDRADQE